jgi:GMP synthase-like glutamine amidotransferase
MTPTTLTSNAAVTPGDRHNSTSNSLKFPEFHIRESAIKPIAIFQHANADRPGHFATYLDEHSLPWVLLRSDRDTLPVHTRDFSGIALMGGEMSANDDLPWIPKLLALIRDAVEADRPVLGHCLGGQLMSRAMGGTVTRNPIKEIGWWEVTVADDPVAASWFGAGVRRFTTFQWHGDTFSVPEGATALLSSANCANQAFARGRHLALQCHVEVNSDIVRSWCSTGEPEIAASQSPAVQSTAEMQRELEARLAHLHLVADRLYDRWVAGLQR